MIPTFEQWFKTMATENGLRTSLGIYPASYGSGQYPPLYFAPISASHVFSLTKIHGKEHPDLLSKDAKKAAKHSDDIDTLGKKSKKNHKKHAKKKKD